MYKVLLIAVIAISGGLTSCSDTNKKENTTNNADTAVLIQDPANTVQANPVKDSTFVDTTHIR